MYYVLALEEVKGFIMLLILDSLHDSSEGRLDSGIVNTGHRWEYIPATSPPAQNAFPSPVPTMIPARSASFHC